jgi:membrane protein
MSLEGLSGLVNRIIARADRLQREHGVLGFPYAVVKKYGDDAGGRQAALITYYGFLSVFAVLLLGAKLLLARPAPVRALWPGAILGAAAVTVVLNAGAPLLARPVAKAGPVYGSFATVAGMFALLYLIGQTLVYAAEVAAVRHARLWPRALDLNHPTEADTAR